MIDQTSAASSLPHFSHIYVEDAASEFPLTKEILSRFPRANLVAIKNYKEVFNRPRQDWMAQKQSTKLILARKPSDFLYSGTEVMPDFGNAHFYYNSLIMNCLYDCHYCYLQGMYPSANSVVFVNLEDFFTQTDLALQRDNEIYLCISYDTDLLAFENIVPYCKAWLEFARSRPNLLIELRTKSANFSAIESVEPFQNVILAWTLSPEAVITRYEHKTPSLKARLTSMSRAAARGWPIRVCIDPILPVEGWQELYSELIAQIFAAIDPSQLRDLSLGSFRMNKDYFKIIKQQRKDTDLLYQSYELQNGLICATKDQQTAIKAHLGQTAGKYIPNEKINYLNVLG